MMDDQRKRIHDKYAPWWAVAMFIFGLAGLSTVWFDMGDFWGGYGLDIMGPAWNYILFRGLFTAYKETRWTNFFTPNRTLIIFVLVAYGIEGAQYMEWYGATYDPFDLLAYVSLLIPLYLLDKRQASGIGHQASGVR